MPREPGSDEPAVRFSLVIGGPLHAVLGRLGLLEADGLPGWRAALGLVLVAWLVPALLVVGQGLVEPSPSGWGFFADPTVYTRYLVGVGVLVATERYADGRIILLTRQFREARLLPDEEVPAFSAALAAADRRSSGWLAEPVLLVSAVVWSVLTTAYAVELAGAEWEGRVVGGGIVWSWAGQAARFVGTPLFLFLVLRWFWRFAVWTLLLFRIARLPLRLTPMHPDRSAGLGFLSIYPSVFSGLAFALSSVVASAILKELSLADHARETVWFALAGWLAISVGLFAGPLLVFVRPLYRARERALLDYGRLATQHHLAFHQRWIAAAKSGEELMGSPDPSSASDLNASVQAVQEMRLIPLDRPALVQLLVASGVPLLAVVAARIPLPELIGWLFGAIV